MSVKIGQVATFANVKSDKAQAMKVLEEAAEVFGAWQEADRSGFNYASPESRAMSTYSYAYGQVLLDECADVIQAVCNLVASLGVTDMGPYMKDCEKRNRERGRYADR